jgi:ribosomal protein S27AE
MTLNPGIEAVRKLANMGYRFTVNGESIKGKYFGPDKPDPAVVSPLLQVARQHRGDVLAFLSCFCPRCGGVASCPDYEGRPVCLACDWTELSRLYPGLAEVKN